MEAATTQCNITGNNPEPHSFMLQIGSCFLLSLSFFSLFHSAVFAAAAATDMSKELCTASDELRQEINLELKGFNESFGWDLCKELREMKVGLTFVNKM